MTTEVAIRAGDISPAHPLDRLSLSRAEDILRLAVAEVDRHSWRAIMVLYHIYSTSLWKTACDDDGVPFSNFEHYLKNLSQRVPRLGVRWGQEMIAAITICTEVLGMSQDQITACSPSGLREIRKTVRWDQKNREVLGYNVEGGKDTVLRLVLDAGAPGVRYTDIKSRVKSAMRTLEVSYTMDDVPDAVGGGSAFKVFAHYDDLPYKMVIFTEAGMPDDVLHDLRRRLGCAR